MGLASSEPASADVASSRPHWQDPGWPPRVWIGLLPFPGRFLVRRRKATTLSALRRVYLGLVAAPVYLLFLLIFLGGSDEKASMSAGVAAGVVAVFGAICLLASLRIRGREVPLDESKVVGAFRAVFFIRFALADAAVMMGFVMFFLGGRHMWIYLIGFVFGMSGLLALAPTKRSLDAWDARRRAPLDRPSLGALFTLEGGP
jgi:hypothetical protein